MKLWSLSLLALLSSSISVATSAAELTQLNQDKSQISFVSKQMGVPVEGRFKKFDAKIAVDPAKPEAGRAQFEVDLGSIDTGNSEADSEVKGKSWFNTSLFPKANFVSKQVRSLGNGRYEALGQLTIKGVARDIAAPFSVKTENGVTLFEGSFTLNRLPFKIGEGVWSDTTTVADEVQVKFKIFLTASAAKK
ncbi:MAG: YceI family protein [Pseudomonadota bacterium]